MIQTKLVKLSLTFVGCVSLLGCGSDQNFESMKAAKAKNVKTANELAVSSNTYTSDSTLPNNDSASTAQQNDDFAIGSIIPKASTTPEAQVPPSSQTSSCAMSNLHPVLNLIFDLNQNRIDKREALKIACSDAEAEKFHIPQSEDMLAKKDLTLNDGAPLAIDVVTQIANAVSLFGMPILDDPKLYTEFQKTFVRRLEQVKKINNPLQKMAATYILADDFNGSYNPKILRLLGNTSAISISPEALSQIGSEKIGYLTSTDIPTPLAVVARAGRTGSGGVCSDFAALLAWSLNSVGNTSIAGGFPEQAGGFRAVIAQGMNHAWVRVYYRTPDNKTVMFDFDPTFYEEQAVPLLSRSRTMTSAQERKNFNAQCTQIKACIANGVNPTR
jgi:hypothetical protein